MRTPDIPHDQARRRVADAHEDGVSRQQELEDQRKKAEAEAERARKLQVPCMLAEYSDLKSLNLFWCVQEEHEDAARSYPVG